MQTSSLFLRTGVLAAIAGMGLGIAMGAMGDHSLRSVHAHINLVGWASMFLFGLYYRVTPDAEGRVARVQYGFALIGFLLMVGALFGIYLVDPATFEPFAIAGSFLTIASMALFVWNVFATTRSASKDVTPMKALQPGLAR